MSVFGVRLGSCVYLCVGMSSCVCPIAYASGYISLPSFIDFTKQASSRRLPRVDYLFSINYLYSTRIYNHAPFHHRVPVLGVPPIYDSLCQYQRCRLRFVDLCVVP